MMVCVHDNALIALEHWIDLFDFTQYQRSKKVLSNLFEESGSYSSHVFRRSEKKPVHLKNQNTEVYFAIIDYLTAVVSRLTTQSADSEFWHNNCLATLTKWAAKMKVLSKDPAKYAMMSLEEGGNLLAREEVLKAWSAVQVMPVNASPEEEADVLAPLPEPKYQTRLGNQKFQPEEDQLTGSYFAEMIFSRYLLFSLLDVVLVGLRGSNLSGYSSNAFEICSLTYGTGFDGSPTLLSQDRDGEITASSLSNCVRNSYIAFRILHQTIIDIQKEQEVSKSESSKEDSCSSTDIEIVWEWHEEEFPGGIENGKLTLSDLDNVVSLIIPLLCTQPLVASLLDESVQMVNLMTSAQDPLQRLGDVKYTALFYMKTAAYDKENTVALTEEDEVRPLSKSLMAYQRLLALEQRVDHSTQHWLSLQIGDRQQIVDEAQAMFAKLRKKFGEWTLDERAITVKCPRYVLTIMVTCVVLVIGGVAVGIFLGNRLTGVDPFNITTFCWVFAAFIILVSKSIRVENWPWRDFFLGRVVCRSVTELHTVTGVDEQDILAYLLHNEKSTILVTRGPFNKPFSRQSEEGFSIDVRLELRTMLLSGIVVVKVATMQGPGLVCLDVRKGTKFRTLVHSHKLEKEEWNLSCTEPPRKDDFESDATLFPMFLGWNRVLGLYNIPKRKFR